MIRLAITLQNLEILKSPFVRFFACFPTGLLKPVRMFKFAGVRVAFVFFMSNLSRFCIKGRTLCGYD